MDERDLENLPVAQNRNPNDVELTRAPKGACAGTAAAPHKAMAKMSIDGTYVCPQCTRSPMNPNRPVNRIKSVGKNAFKDVKKKGLDGKTYIEKVPKSKAEMAAEVNMQDGKPGSEAFKEALKKKAPVLNKLGEAIEKSKATDYPLEALDSITNYFDAAPSKTIAEFKKVDKIRKATVKLRAQIKDYLGGK